MTTNPEPVVIAPGQHSEGPVWDAAQRRLLWVDPRDRAIGEYRPGTGLVTSTQYAVRIAAFAPRRGGGFVVAAGMGFGTLDDLGGSLTLRGSVDRGNSMNDGKCDPAGRFLAGTMIDEAHHGQAALYRLDGNGVSPVLEGVTLSNGLGWSPDGGTLYYIDTVEERVDAFDYDVESGAIRGRRVFTDLHSVPGRPDGLTVDRDGGVWVAMARGGRAVRRFTARGRPDYVQEMPVSNVTSVTFGGDGLGDLFVTTSRLRLTEEDLREQPSAGSVFRVRGLGVTGLPVSLYEG